MAGKAPKIHIQLCLAAPGQPGLPSHPKPVCKDYKWLQLGRESRTKEGCVTSLPSTYLIPIADLQDHTRAELAPSGVFLCAATKSFVTSCCFRNRGENLVSWTWLSLISKIDTMQHLQRVFLPPAIQACCLRECLYLDTWDQRIGQTKASTEKK